MRLKLEEIKKIRELYNKSKAKRGIMVVLAKQFKVSPATIQYHVDNNYNQNHKKNAVENFRKKPLAERQAIYKTRLVYLREYKRTHPRDRRTKQ